MEKKYKMLKEDTIEVKGHTLYRIEALRDFGIVKKGNLGGFVEKEKNLSQFGGCWVFDNAKVFDNARVSDDAKVFDNALVYGDAEIFGNARIYGNAEIFGNARIYGNAKVSCEAKVYCNALVYGDAEICEGAIVFGCAEVYDNAVIRGDAEVFGNARVFGDAIVSDDAKVFGKSEVFNSSVLTVNAYITNTNDYINIGPIGSRDAYTTFYLNEDKKIIVNCGCFNDTIEEFIKAVNRTHKDNKKYRSQYIGAITYAKCVLYNESIL